MALPTGMNLRVVSQGFAANSKYVLLAGEGTYTAADFSVGPAEGLGFTPVKARFVNLTDRVQMEHFFNAQLGTANAEGLKTIDAGTVTYEATGLSVSGRTLNVDVSVALLTDNDDFIIECWGA
jgi:hypothetical protein